MSEHPAGETTSDFDKLLNFTLPERNARGRIVRLGPVLGKILAAHDYPPAIKQLLAEALVLTALMGSLLKKEGSQLTMQAQTEAGVVELLVCDYRDGELRGYVKHDADKLRALEGRPTLAALFGEGSLTVTFDVPSGAQRYQGMVPLEGDSLTEAVERYFARSEQVPTVIRAAVRISGERCSAGGMLVQHLAEGEEGRERLHIQASHPEWEHVAILTQSVREDELVDRGLSSEELLWRLFHEEREIRVQRAAELSRGCRCSVVHFEEVLARFSKEDRREMRDENGIIRVDCAFCSKQFPIQD